MRTRHETRMIFVTWFCLSVWAWGWDAEAKTPTMPVMFERNMGQAAEDVSYVARGRGFVAHVRPAELVMVYGRKEAMSVARMRLVGARNDATMKAIGPISAPVTYARGSGTGHEMKTVPVFGSVRSVGVYDGIDLVWRGEDGNLVYDFEVGAGAEASRIEMVFPGVEMVKRDGDGALMLETKRGVIRQAAPVMFQVVDGVRRMVEGGYELREAGRVGFKVGAYDRSLPLVIDPVMTYSTFLGGSNIDGAQAVAVDAAGHMYVTGETSSSNFSVTGGAYDTSANGDADVFVAKFHRNTGALMYATYIGGSGDDSGFDIAVDAQGNAYVTGLTDSSGFPTTTGAFDRSLGGLMDGFVTKLNATGTALVYSTFVGGSGFEFFTAISVDDAGNAYVAGNSDSTDFPVTAGAYRTTRAGGMNDAVVFKLNAAGSALVFSTFLGGNGQDEANGLTLSKDNEVIVTGFTDSTNFPTTPGALDTTKGGRGDAFVTRLNAAGSALVSSTYLGGSLSAFTTSFAGYDAGYDVKVDGFGNIYVVGETVSTNFPVTAGAFQTQLTGVYKAFVAKLSPGMSNLVYATYLGGGGDEFARAVTVDGYGATRVAGKTISQNFPVTGDALQAARLGMSDAFLTVLAANGSALSFSTYWGGTQAEDAFGLRHDTLGNLVMVGDTDSSNFPVTSGAFDTSYNSGGDAYLTKFKMEDGASLVVRVPPESDAVVSVPFELPVVYTGTVTVVAGNTITVSGTPFAGQTYAAQFYVRFKSGGRNGLWSTVSANTANTLTLADTSVVSGVAVGNQFDLRPHQTLNTVFPAGLAGVSYLTSVSASIRKTEVLTMDNLNVAINKSSSATYYHLSGAWRRAGSAGGFGSIVLPPDQPFVLRNKGNASALLLMMNGQYATGHWGRLIPTHASLSNDLYVNSGRPIAVTLNELMLGGTAAFASSSSASVRADELLVFDNAATGQNKSATATFYYLAGVWRQAGSGADWGNLPVIGPGTGFIIRKKNGAPGLAVWSAAAPY